MTRVTVEDIFKAGKTINVAVIAGSTPECLLTQIAAAQHFADMIELRLDLSPKLSPEIWQVCLTQIKLPWLLTYRSQAEGGFGDNASDIRIGMVKRFIKLNPSLVDIEFMQKDINNILKIKKEGVFLDFIASLHITPAHNHVTITAEFLQRQSQKLAQQGASGLKVVCCAWGDYLNLMAEVKGKKFALPLTILAQGSDELAVLSRVLGKVHQQQLVFWTTATTRQRVPQLSSIPDFDRVCQRYPWHQLGQKSQLYGLIGDPVTQSVGDKWHNQRFSQQQYAAVYCKIKLTAGELAKGLRHWSNSLKGQRQISTHKTKYLPVSNN